MPVPAATVFQLTTVNPFFNNVPVLLGNVIVVESVSVIAVGTVPLVDVLESKEITGAAAFH